MTIILSIILGVIAVLLNKNIRKYSVYIFTLSTLLAIASLIFSFDLLMIITEGYLGLSFFIIVMMAGALKKGSKLSKKLKSVRKEYSILGFIFLLPHFILYIIEFLNSTMPVELFGVLAMIVMIPLFITSFKVFKSKMNIKKWKKIQKYAYLA